MFGWFKRKRRPSGSFEVASRQTTRSDWDVMIPEIFMRVIEGCRFGIGVITEQQSMLNRSLKYRINQNYGDQGIPDYIRRKFKPAHFNHIFQSGEGLAEDSRYHLYKVVGKNLGLPANSLVCPIENPTEKNLRALIVFGGERLEGQMEARLNSLDAVLGGAPPPARGKNLPTGPSKEELIKSLGKLNTKRLFDYKLDELAEIVNGLEESKEELSRPMKPIFMAVSQFILNKQLRR